MQRARTAARTLTWRLVALLILLVAVTAAVIGTATTLAMRDHLDDQLDTSVLETMERTLRSAGGPPPGDQAGREDFGPGQEFGTLRAVVPDDGDPQGVLLSEREEGTTALSSAQLDALADLSADEGARSVDLPDLGSYRVLATDLDGGRVVVGLPRSEVDTTMANLVRLEVLATLVGVVVAGAVGLLVVRRQLAPLREVAATAHRVAELPLASGDIDMSVRVPGRLTDERTEVGQVASALNTMLDHVEASLETRHRSEQQVRRFVADASHELRTPLATIAGYTELARRRPEATGTALGKVEAESARMTSLVEDLLLLARLDAGRPLEHEAVDLSLLLLEAVNDARVVDADRDWRLDLPVEPVTVIGDAARLHQVVTNLLTNASKYTPAGTTVTVTASHQGFSVHDTGPGFPEDLVPQAFERFSRGDAARQRAGGAGLGLSLVDAIVAAHGGTVTLRSNPGDTMVDVRLPGGGASLPPG